MTGTQAIHEQPIPLAKAAKLLGVSPKSVARFAFDKDRKKRLEVVKVGSRWMTTREACARFLDEAQSAAVVRVDTSRADRAIADYFATEGKA